MKFPARMDGYKAQKADPPLPPVTATHVLDWLMEVGPTEATAMGQSPLSWSTIHAWRVETRTIVAPWEARLLRRLSGEYLAEIQLAEDRMRPAPWSPVGVEVDREAEERNLRSVLG